MLSVKPTEPDESNVVRVVIDETSFDFHGLGTAVIDEHLNDFNEAVWELREEGIATWKPPMIEFVTCVDGLELYEYLAGAYGEGIDRDTKNRFFGLMSKCPDWDDSIPSGTDVALDGAEPVMALSVSFALALALKRHGVGCLVFGPCARRGFVTASSELGQAEIFFFAAASELTAFWRSLYELEDTAEGDFFVLASRAFPDLILHRDLSFRRFDGIYQNLRSPVVRHLSVLNDHFIEAYKEANGIAREVESLLAPLGCPDISPESPNTHRNQHAMRTRDVQHGEEFIRCEWHTKIEPHRNRIHFAFGGSFGPKVFVGIFADHLPT